MTEIEINKITELIKRRRRQILVHSYIYYQLDKNVIDDAVYSQWSEELFNLQKLYPDISENTEFYKEFKDWDYSTGFNLDYHKEWVYRIAKRLLKQK